LTQLLEAHLPAYMVPTDLVLVAELPLTPNGKIDRAALAARAPGAAGTENRNPRDRIELELANIWAEILDLDQVSIDDDFFALGGHSLLSVRLMNRIAKKFGTELPVTSLFQNRTVAAQASLLRNTVAHKTTADPLVTLGRPGSPDLYLVHPVGGSVMCYAGLARALDGFRTLHAFETPARQGGELLETVEALAAHYSDRLLQTHESGPIQLGGWSMGGLVAYEMARLLDQRGHRPDQVILIDAWAEDLGTNKDSPISENLASAYHFITDLERLSGRSLDLDYARLSTLSEEEALAHAFQRIRAQGLMTGGGDQTSLERLYRVFRDNKRAMNHYHPEPYTGKVTLLLPETEPAAAAWPDRGWNPLIGKNLECIAVPGDHYTMLQHPNLTTLVPAMQTALDLAR
jgi:thioesterase domain-containing protein/acyl carrier protein